MVGQVIARTDKKKKDIKVDITFLRRSLAHIGTIGGGRVSGGH